MFFWTFHQSLLAFFPPEIRVSALEKEYRHAQVHHIQSIFCENDNNLKKSTTGLYVYMKTS